VGKLRRKKERENPRKKGRCGAVIVAVIIT
jgi:hypothetical protein